MWIFDRRPEAPGPGREERPEAPGPGREEMADEEHTTRGDSACSLARRAAAGTVRYEMMMGVVTRAEDLVIRIGYVVLCAHHEIGASLAQGGTTEGQ